MSDTESDDTEDARFSRRLGLKERLLKFTKRYLVSYYRNFIPRTHQILTKPSIVNYLVEMNVPLPDKRQLCLMNSTSHSSTTVGFVTYSFSKD